jgi:hypothetical protein
MAVAVPSHAGSIDGSLGVSVVVEGIEAAVNAPNVSYSAAANTVGFTATPAQVAGPVPAPDDNVYLDLTGAVGAGANIQLPTVAALAATLQNLVAGQSWMVRILNHGSASTAWTVTTNTGWTLNGTMTIALNTWRDFLITMTSSSAAVIQNLGGGTVP